MKNYYEILEVPVSASSYEIKKAYHKLALKYHPDRDPTNISQEKFKDITAAYKVLSSKDQRHKYDLEYYYFYKTQNHNFSSSSYDSVNRSGTSFKNEANEDKRYSSNWAAYGSNTQYKVYVNYSYKKKGDISSFLSSLFVAFFVVFFCFFNYFDSFENKNNLNFFSFTNNFLYSLLLTFSLLKFQNICAKKISSVWQKIIKIKSLEVKIIYSLLSILSFCLVKDIFLFTTFESKSLPFYSQIDFIFFVFFCLNYFFLRLKKKKHAFQKTRGGFVDEFFVRSKFFPFMLFVFFTMITFELFSFFWLFLVLFSFSLCHLLEKYPICSFLISYTEDLDT